MMGTREKLRGGDEFNFLTRKGRKYTGWRRHVDIARVKRQFWKRVRKQSRAVLAAEPEL